MARIVLEGKLLKWDNSYGVRISKGDVERARLQVGAPMTVTPGEPGRIDISHIRVLRGKDRFPGWSHDDVLYLGMLEKLLRSGNISKAEFARDKKTLEEKYVGR